MDRTVQAARNLSILFKYHPVLYHNLRIVTRLAIRIFCRRIIINKPEMLDEKGPLLLACNHPNSFLDAVILDTLFNQPIHSLARGDIFINKFITKILTSLKILPVYRVSEGVENLSSNYDTFSACKEIFKKNGIILIFSEGRCINEWKLRPLKKGTARLALNSWDNNIPLKVLPVGINYSSFRRFGKNVILNFGTILNASDFNLDKPDGVRNQQFNVKLYAQLKELVLDINEDDRQEQKQLLEFKPSLAKRILLFLPAIIGWLSHLPIYLPMKFISKLKASHNDHYDSVLTALLLFTYPLYILLASVLLYCFTGSLWAFSLLVLLPLSAWSVVQLKPQLDK